MKKQRHYTFQEDGQGQVSGDQPATTKKFGATNWCL